MNMTKITKNNYENHKVCLEIAIFLPTLTLYACMPSVTRWQDASASGDAALHCYSTLEFLILPL